jgi:hypothetical protein
LASLRADTPTGGFADQAWHFTTSAREVYMRTDNGEAHVRRIAPSANEQVERIEIEAWRHATIPPPAEAPFNPDDALF